MQSRAAATCGNGTLLIAPRRPLNNLKKGLRFLLIARSPYSSSRAIGAYDHSFLEHIIVEYIDFGQLFTYYPTAKSWQIYSVAELLPSQHLQSAVYGSSMHRMLLLPSADPFRSQMLYFRKHIFNDSHSSLEVFFAINRQDHLLDLFKECSNGQLT